ncbi:MAG: ABC transporter [Gammaproteobacteria bacterium]|nr:MAG: ABC transporter [Gammaproteobacteria bacterium]TND06795.1 MAG: ABC transporter [Gammaproteobacteria bacterium]
MIRLEEIDRVFEVGDQRVQALNDINLHVEPGEYLSIMGPSGSGKSTLLNVIGLLDRPTSGRYFLSGNDVTSLSEDALARTRRADIGFVFQFFHLVPRLTAAENIELPLMLEGIAPAERKPRVDEVLDALDIRDRAHHRPDQLSGGQRQRVAIARATIMKPAILLADEPTGNLDQASGKEVIDTLERLNASGITLLIVTHDQQLGDRARRYVKMVDGRIVTDQTRG